MLPEFDVQICQNIVIRAMMKRCFIFRAWGRLGKLAHNKTATVGKNANRMVMWTNI